MNYAEAYNWYVAQVIQQIDAEIAEKGNFWLQTIKLFPTPHTP
jgi:hypothetical protein